MAEKQWYEVGQTTNNIQDTTGNGEITKVNPIENEWIQFALENQKNLWQREDDIRTETQKREDTAYQRAVDDARKAGINPNLINLQPAASGGGISNASGLDTSIANSELERQHEAIQKELDRQMEELQKQLDRDFEKDQAKRDRIMDLVKGITQTIISTGGNILGGMIIKGM